MILLFGLEFNNLSKYTEEGRMYLIVLFIALGVIYLLFVREEAPSQGAQAQEAGAGTTTDEPPKPSEPPSGGDVDPFQSPVSPKS